MNALERMVTEERNLMPRFAREKLIERLALTRDSLSDDFPEDNAIKGKVFAFQQRLKQLVLRLIGECSA